MQKREVNILYNNLGGRWGCKLKKKNALIVFIGNITHVCIEQRCQDLYEKTYIYGTHRPSIYYARVMNSVFKDIFCGGRYQEVNFLKKNLQVFKNIFKVFFS